MGEASSLLWNSVSSGAERPSTFGHTSPEHGEIGLDVLDSLLRAGVVAADASLGVRYASKRAGILMTDGSGLQVRDGRIHIDRTSVGRRLQDAIRALINSADPQDHKPVLVGIPNNDGRVRYAIKVLATVRSLDQEQLALLVIVDLLQQDSVSRTAVASLFGLSDREAELADYFSQGMRLDEIAQAMGVAANTARVHLRSVFTKTGCNSQIELARLFALVP